MKWEILSLLSSISEQANPYQVQQGQQYFSVQAH
jgi:hypothetical protein